jgi:hypothetical protein
LLSKKLYPKKVSFKFKPLHIFALLVALGWTYLSGAGGFAFQNGDWVKHNAMLYDLVTRDWPVTYTINDVPAFLNYYLGLYMVPALIGKLTNMQTALNAQFVWIFCGVVLSYAWLTRIIKKPRVLVIIFFILFATADSLGLIMVRNFTLFNFITPLEHWTATPHEYSSFSTLLFWVPGQAIGLWIVMGVLIDMYKKEKTEHFPIFASLLMFWSPLGFVGMLPFALFAIKKNKLLLINIACALLILLFFYFYYSANIFGTLHAKEYMGLWKADARIFWLRFAIFIFSEAFVPIALIFSLKKHLDEKLKKLFYIAAIMLLTLPFFKYGLLNDLVMRSSIPSIFIIFLCSYSLLVSKRVRQQHKFLWLGLIIYFILGSVTSVTEINRAIRSEPNYGTPTHVTEIGDPLATKQYMGFEDSFIAKKILKLTP